MRHLNKLLALAVLCFASSALAQNAGTVTNHAFALGKGPGVAGYTSLLCGSAQLAVGQSAADPICRTITGDVTISAAGATAIGSTKVTSAMLNADVFSTAHSWAGTQTFVAPVLGTPASATLTNATGLPISGISGLAAGIAAFLATSSSANLATAITDETGTGALVFGTSPSLTTPTLGAATATSINKVAITAPATAATLAIPDGVTLTGPASSGTAMTLGNTETVTGIKTFGSAGAVGRLKIGGTTSGSTTLDATAAASGTLTLPAATDTLVGKATTDTLTNKTFDTAGTGNSFSINGVAATANTGTGAVVRATSPALVTPALGTPASGVATNLTGLPLTTGVTGTLPKANGGLGATTLSSAIDTEFSSVQGSVLYRNATAWVALGPGTAGQFLTTQGPSANPNWSGGGAGTGTVTSVTCGGLAITTAGTCPEPFIFANCSLAASVASNILTVALKDNAGADPSATSPCRIGFRSATAATGTPTYNSVTSALSITTNATGATLGSSNATAFRFWVVAFDNAGTTVLSLFNASVGSNCYPIDQGRVQSSTPISGSAISGNVFYTPNGTTVTSKAIRVLGYIEYNSSGLTTAGTYATAPNFIEIFGPGIKLPCEPMQTISVTGIAEFNTASTTYVDVTGGTVSITPTSAANRVRVENMGSGFGGTGANAELIALLRTSTIIVDNFLAVAGAPVSQSVIDTPNTASSVTYKMQIKNNGSGTVYWPCIASCNGTIGAQMRAIEIQG